MAPRDPAPGREGLVIGPTGMANSGHFRPIGCPAGGVSSMGYARLARSKPALWAVVVVFSAVTAGASAHAAAGGRSGAPLEVGAATVSYAPPCGPDGTPTANNCTLPPAGFTDPADCNAAVTNVVPAGTPLDVFSGRRLFAFEE